MYIVFVVSLDAKKGMEYKNEPFVYRFQRSRMFSYKYTCQTTDLNIIM